LISIGTTHAKQVEAKAKKTSLHRTIQPAGATIRIGKPGVNASIITEQIENIRSKENENGYIAV